VPVSVSAPASVSMSTLGEVSNHKMACPKYGENHVPCGLIKPDTCWPSAARGAVANQRSVRSRHAASISSWEDSQTGFAPISSWEDSEPPEMSMYGGARRNRVSCSAAPRYALSPLPPDGQGCTAPYQLSTVRHCPQGKTTAESRPAKAHPPMTSQAPIGAGSMRRRTAVPARQAQVL